MKTKEAQIKIIEKDLRAGRVVSTWQAIRDHKITRATARLWDLKERGLSIDKKKVEKNGKRYTEYRLQK